MVTTLVKPSLPLGRVRSRRIAHDYGPVLRQTDPMGVTGAVRVDDLSDRVDWDRAKADLAADQFDNGRSAHALRRSFVNSQHVAYAWLNEDLVGMARMLSDGVCNAYLLDVWTQSAVRTRGIGTLMVDYLTARVPGQHIGLQTDDAKLFYAGLGFGPQPEFMSRIVGRWLDNEANRSTAVP